MDKVKNTTWNHSTKVWDNSAVASIGLIDVFAKLVSIPILIRAMPTGLEVENSFRTENQLNKMFSYYAELLTLKKKRND